MAPVAVSSISHTVTRMFDGARLRIHERAQRRLRVHPALFFSLDRDGKYRARWHGWTFEGDATRCWEVRGSFHKAHHGGENWKDYTRAQFHATVAALCDAFDLHPASLSVAGLEVGVNLVLTCPVAEVLDRILLHRTTAPIRMAGAARGIEFQYGHKGRNYRYKIYDKGHQYALPAELLRFEVAVRQMRILAPIGVRTVADLLERDVWERVAAFLLAKFDELLIVEPHMPTAALRSAQRDLVANASEPRYWQGMPRQRRSERRRALDALFTRYASPNLKAALRACIVAKLGELTADAPDLTPDIFAGGPVALDPDKCATWVKGENVTGNIFGASAAEVSELMPLEPVRRCRACGADIGHQVPGSVYCSERRNGRDGKSCRNRGSNYTRTLRELEQRGPFLFDHTAYLRPALGAPQRRRISTFTHAPSRP